MRDDSPRTALRVLVRAVVTVAVAGGLPAGAAVLSGGDLNMGIMAALALVGVAILSSIVLGFRAALCFATGYRWTAAAFGIAFLVPALPLLVVVLKSHVAPSLENVGTRRGFSATLLADGRVLVAGGVPAAFGGWGGPGGTLRSTLLYDPTASAWTEGPRMEFPRSHHEAVLLADGRVLVVGGTDWSAEVYDPSRSDWSPVSSPTLLGSVDRALLMKDGRVSVLSCLLSCRVEVYDPEAGTWTPREPKPTSRDMYRPAAVALLDGRVLVLGGSWAELYDPTLGTWAATADMLAEGTVAIRLPTGRVLVLGNESGCCLPPPETRAQLYDPVVGAWTVTSSLPKPLANDALLVMLRDGRVLLRQQSGAQAYTYDPRDESWEALGPVGPSNSVPAVLQDGRVLLIDGRDASSELYDPATRAATPAGSFAPRSWPERLVKAIVGW